MRLHTVIAAFAPALLSLGCQTAAPAIDDGQLGSSSVDSASAFPAERTATLWVKGMGCPY